MTIQSASKCFDVAFFAKIGIPSEKPGLEAGLPYPYPYPYLYLYLYLSPLSSPCPIPMEAAMTPERVDSLATASVSPCGNVRRPARGGTPAFLDQLNEVKGFPRLF